MYLCAVSDIDWNKTNISNVYEKFLSFLENNICITMDAPPYISKDQHCDVLCMHINAFRSFLRGDDEPVISKDLHQTLNSRYVYLPYLWSLVEANHSTASFSSFELQTMISNALLETDIYKKGILWEDVAAYILSNVPGWKITGRRIKAGSQEIDLSVANISMDNDLWQLGAYILVECKNWNSHVDIRQIRNIAHISNMKGNKTAILFAANDITADAKDEVNRLNANNICIICITANDLKCIYSAEDCKTLIMRKWQELQSNTDFSMII